MDGHLRRSLGKAVLKWLLLVLAREAIEVGSPVTCVYTRRLKMRGLRWMKSLRMRLFQHGSLRR